MNIWKNWGYIIKLRNKDQQSINKEGTNEKTIRERPIILLTSLTFALTQYTKKNIRDKSQNKIRNRNKQQITNNKLMMQTTGDANTHKCPMLKLKMQIEQDIPCDSKLKMQSEREIESVRNKARGRPSNRARPRARGRRRMRASAGLKGRLRACGRVW